MRQASLFFKIVYFYVLIAFFLIKFSIFQILISMLGIPRCQSQQISKRSLMNSTGNLFTRIDNFGSTRSIKTTSKAARAFPHLTKNQSLDNSKQNINYASFLSKVKSATKIDQKNNASKYLLALRKEYDKMAKNIKAKQLQISTMNRDIQFIQQKSKGHTGLFSDAKQRLQKRQQQLQQMVLKQDTARMETKVLENIIQRMKSDQLKNKLTNRQRQLEAKGKIRQLKLYQEEILQWDDAIHKTVQKANQIKNQFVKNMEDRLQKLHDFESRVEELQDHEKFQMQRKERTYELLSMESNDIMDAKNVVLRDVLMANKLLDKLLQSKINDLLSNYEKTQNSYHVIRNQTNISDPQSMTKKFFSYNEVLEELTSTITFYQKRQEELLKRNEELKTLQKNKINKMLQEKRNLNQQKQEIENEKEEIVKETINKQFAIKNLCSWLFKHLKKFNLSESGDFGEQIKDLCSHVIEQVYKMNGISLGDKKFQSPGIRLKKVVRQLSIQDEKIRRSEAQEVRESNLHESKYLAVERSKVKNHFLIKTQIPRSKNV